MPKLESSQTGDRPNAATAAVSPSSPTSPQPPVNRTLHWVLWSVLILVIGALVASFVRQQWRGAERRSFSRLERFKTIPDFALTDQNNQRFDSGALRGKIWLADFFFTACPGPCLVMNGRVQEVQEALRKTGQDVKLISFSINPEGDTPSVLHRYAERFHAKPGQWFFLTGERARIYDVARNGFLLAVQEADDSPTKNQTAGAGAGSSEAPSAAEAAARADLQKAQAAQMTPQAAQTAPSTPIGAASASTAAPSGASPAKPEEQPIFVHSTKIALVDRQGVVRGYYDSTNPEVVQQMLTDIGNLLREQPSKTEKKF